MKKIKLTSIAIQNFKGCTQRTVDFGTTTNIYGANAAGKTTIADAFTWLLFGTDTAGASKFDVRPLDADGNTIDNTDIKVAAVLDVDGETIVLKKIQRQNWTKKRGELEPRLTGNANLFEIDGFPASDAEFKAKVAEIIPADLFRLLTDPRAFAAMPWKDQRDILTGMALDVSDADIVADNPTKYAPVLDDLKAAPAEKCLEKAKAELKSLNKALNEYPARIDQASKALQPVQPRDQLEERWKELHAQLEQVQAQERDADQTYKAVSDLQAEVMQAKLDADALVNQANMDLRIKTGGLQTDVHGHELMIASMRADLTQINARIDEAQKRLEDTRAFQTKLVDQWEAAKALTMDENDTVCKFCGQPLPADQAEAIRKEFEERKKINLENITHAGNTNRAQIDSLTAEIERLQNEAAKIGLQISAENTEMQLAQKQLDGLPESVDPMRVEGYPAALEKLNGLQAKLDAMETGDAVKAELAAREENIQNELADLNRDYAAIEFNAKQQAVVDDLRAGQKETAQKAADQERRLYLLDEMTKAKMERMADGINAKFKAVRFKLFETQFNGAVVPTCQTTMGGVPYASLNSAGKLQAGLDVIAVLQDLYGVCAPIWIDNRESVSVLPETSAQTINLYVSPADTELRVEVVTK